MSFLTYILHNRTNQEMQYELVITMVINTFRKNNLGVFEFVISSLSVKITF